MLLITFDCVIKSLPFIEAKLLELLLDDSLSRLSFSPARKLGLFSRACSDFLHTVKKGKGTVSRL